MAKIFDLETGKLSTYTTIVEMYRMIKEGFCTCGEYSDVVDTDGKLKCDACCSLAHIDDISEDDMVKEIESYGYIVRERDQLKQRLVQNSDTEITFEINEQEIFRIQEIIADDMRYYEDKTTIKSLIGDFPNGNLGIITVYGLGQKSWVDAHMLNHACEFIGEIKKCKNKFSGKFIVIANGVEHRMNIKKV